MEDLESITSEVRQCLDDNPRTRDSDNLLYWMIAQDILQKQDIDIDRMGFTELFLSLNSYGIPKYETVVRIRRYIQRKYPELMGTERIEKARAHRSEVIADYVRE